MGGRRQEKDIEKEKEKERERERATLSQQLLKLGQLARRTCREIIEKKNKTSVTHLRKLVLLLHLLVVDQVRIVLCHDVVGDGGDSLINKQKRQKQTTTTSSGNREKAVKTAAGNGSGGG